MLPVRLPPEEEQLKVQGSNLRFSIQLQRIMSVSTLILIAAAIMGTSTVVSMAHGAILHGYCDNRPLDLYKVFRLENLWFHSIESVYKASRKEQLGIHPPSFALIINAAGKDSGHEVVELRGGAIT
ncbi:hypothetical protein F5146DRAFT_1138470 [Armillaria mellea]|nr:hypothetical protein F5146DRAFT_1138470 [Armillaria mellea]